VVWRILTLPVGSQPSQVAVPHPVLAVSGTPTHDFKTLSVGRFPCEFILQNIGPTPIRPEVKVSCACTTVLEFPDTITPGDRSSVKLQLNTTGMHGPFTKRVLVSARDAESPLELTLEGVVDPTGQLRLRDDAIDMGSVEYGRAGTVRVAIDRIGVPLGDCKLQVSNPKVTAHLVADAKSSTGTLELTYQPSGFPEKLAEQVVIETTSGPRSIRSLSVFGISTGPVAISPYELTFGRVTPDVELATAMRITPTMPEFAARIVSSDIPVGTTALCRQNSDGTWVVGLQGRCDAGQQGAFMGHITIATNVASCPSMRFRVVGVVADRRHDGGS